MRPRILRHLLLSLAVLFGGATLAAQETATIRGTVTQAGTTDALAGVQISVQGTGLATATGVNGRYVVQRVPTGPQVIIFRWLGYAPLQREVNVTGDMTLDVELEPQPVSLADLTVSAASREPERIVEAPAAVTLIEPRVLANTAPTH